MMVFVVSMMSKTHLLEDMGRGWTKRRLLNLNSRLLRLPLSLPGFLDSSDSTARDTMPIVKLWTISAIGIKSYDSQRLPDSNHIQEPTSRAPRSRAQCCMG